MSDEQQDLTVAGDGSPISLKKVIELDMFDSNNAVSVLLDQSNSGFFTRDAPVQAIKFEDAKMNAEYFLKEHFHKRGKLLPPYLYRHLIFMYYPEHEDIVYPFDKYRLSNLIDFLKTPEGKALDAEIKKKIEFMEYNNEWLHLVGMIICLHGCLYVAKQEGVSARLYLEHPEAYMHPKQERKFMSMLNDMYLEHTGHGIDGKPKTAEL